MTHEEPLRISKRGAFIAAAVIVVFIALMAYASYLNHLEDVRGIGTHFEKLEVVYVAANQTSQEVYCKLRNTGTQLLTLTEVSVDGDTVRTGDLLPVPIGQGEVYTYTFRYDGRWEGSINVVLRTAKGNDYPKAIDLQAASKNSVAEAFAGYLDGLLGTVVFESAEARVFVDQAKSMLRVAREAYSRGEYKTADHLAASTLILVDAAFRAEKAYQDDKVEGIISVVEAVSVTAAIVGSLMLLGSKRKVIESSRRWRIIAQIIVVAIIVAAMILLMFFMYLQFTRSGFI